MFGLYIYYRHDGLTTNLFESVDVALAYAAQLLNSKSDVNQSFIVDDTGAYFCFICNCHDDEMIVVPMVVTDYEGSTQ